jgi:hypothetical protein
VALFAPGKRLICILSLVMNNLPLHDLYVRWHRLLTQLWWKLADVQQR